MTKFADQLFTDLMAEHGPALERSTPPARRVVPRPVWLAAGVVGMAGAVTAGMAVFGSGAPAYAVTPNDDGTVTISINQMTGLDGANLALHNLGDRVVVVPVRPGCPPIGSLPVAKPVPGQETSLRIGVREHDGGNGTVTVDAHGVPAGDTMVVAAEQTAQGVQVASVLISGPAPRCVSDLPPTPIPGPGSGHSGRSVAPGPAGSGTSSGH